MFIDGEGLDILSIRIGKHEFVGFKGQSMSCNLVS